ncbi:MAG: nucleoside permease [Bacteroidota bacterium]
MSLKLRLIILNFFQFFIWGCWLITIGAWWFQTRQWSSTQFGAIFSTMGIASLFMPAIAGIIADRWVNAEKLYGIFHLCGAVLLFFVPQMKSPDGMFWIMMLNMVCYMPTLGLGITVSYSSMKQKNMDIIREFPPIRVWGTIGFIVALWVISLSGLETSSGQFYVASCASLLLGLYAFTLPKCPPLGKGHKKSLVAALGLDAFKLFKNYRMAIFFLFAVFLGAALQLTNAFGDTFLHDFAKTDQYKDLIAVRYPAIIMSMSQISEALFFLTIPFFLRKFGIKKVMLLSMIAWVLRFGLFAYGNPGGGLWMIILSCIVYGIAFDYYNVPGSMYVETQTDPSMRASAQGLFMMMTNGLGAVLGSRVSAIAIDKYFRVGDTFNWHGIWTAFAIYALIMTILFAVLFRDKTVMRDA